MKVLSLFSGVGGFDMGLEASGMTTAFQCEIDKHARAVLDHHWPDVPKWDDVSTLTGAHILEVTGGVDVVAWGSPCQDLSLAGKRAGLSGERSGLFHQGIRIIKELRELSNGISPTWSIWENVVGALSSNGGSDFGEVLFEMDEAGACFSEWAVLDAQYFGVPQRRRRVFVTSCFDSGVSSRCPEPLFPVSESVSGDSAKGSKTRKRVTAEVADSVGTSRETATYVKSRRAQSVDDHETWIESDVTPTLNAFDIGDIRTVTAVVETEPIFFQAHQSGETRVQDGVMHTLATYMGTGGNNTPMVAQDPIIIDRAAFNQGENAQYEPYIAEETKSPSLVARGPHAVAQEVEAIGLLTARDYKGAGNQYVNENKLVVSDAVAYPIDTRNALRDPEKKDAVNRQGLGIGAEGDPSPTITNVFVPGVAHAEAYDEYNDTLGGDIHHALRSGTKQSTGVFIQEPVLVVRRLTPLECERLMGWPDNHTAQGVNGEISDSQRYKMCGNGVASPVATWVGKHIMKVGQDV